MMPLLHLNIVANTWHKTMPRLCHNIVACNWHENTTTFYATTWWNAQQAYHSYASSWWHKTGITTMPLYATTLWHECCKTDGLSMPQHCGITMACTICHFYTTTLWRKRGIHTKPLLSHIIVVQIWHTNSATFMPQHCCIKKASQLCSFCATTL